MTKSCLVFCIAFFSPVLALAADEIVYERVIGTEFPASTNTRLRSRSSPMAICISPITVAMASMPK